MPKDAPHPPRSPKAGRPPVARARKRGTTAVRKDTMMLQAARGPRVLWGRTRAQVKKG